MTDTRVSIHPNPTGPTHAESPYTRKLKRLYDDVKLVESISPLEHKGILNAMLFDIEGLINN